MTRSRRRPWFSIGPGLLVASGLVLAMALTGRLAPPRSRPALPEHSGLPAAAPLAPEPTWLLRQAAEIGLSPSQQGRLEAVVEDWRAATADDRARLEAESAALAQRLDTAGGAPPERVLAVEGETYLTLSAQLAEARQTAWQAALELLDESQRGTVARLREAAPQEMR